jgi:hypothetical protein
MYGLLYLASMKLTTRNSTCSINEAPMIATSDCADTASISSAEREMVCHTIIAYTHTYKGAMKYVSALRKCKQARPALSKNYRLIKLEQAVRERADADTRPIDTAARSLLHTEQHDHSSKYCTQANSKTHTHAQLRMHNKRTRM